VAGSISTETGRVLRVNETTDFLLPLNDRSDFWSDNAHDFKAFDHSSQAY